MANSKKTESEGKVVRRKRVPAGPKRNKKRSMERLIEAVGEVIQEKGYHGLLGSHIANVADVNSSLIWTYFKGVDKLIETYILQRDFWNKAEQNIIRSMLENPDKIGRKDITALLHGQLDQMLEDKILQRIIQWEIGEKNETLRKVADRREVVGENLFKVIEPDFEKAAVDIRPRLALQIAGIYYLVLHAQYNGSLFCGLDINKPEDLERLQKAIEDNIHDIYEKAKVEK